MDKEKFFFISDGINLIGPFNKEELLRKIYVNELTPKSKIYDAKLKSWSRILDHSHFKASDFEENNLVVFGLHSANNQTTGLELKKKKRPRVVTDPQLSQSSQIQSENLSANSKASQSEAPPGPVKSSLGPDDTIFVRTSVIQAQSAINSERWYVRDGKFIIGPYHYLSLLLMLSDGTISLNEAIRREDQKVWKTVDEIISARELKDFKTLENIKNQIDMPRALSQRKFERISFERFIYIHYFEGLGNSQRSDHHMEQVIALGYDLSETGLGFVVEETTLQPGARLSCVLIKVDERPIEIDAKVVRVEEIQSRTVGVNLCKVALSFDHPIDLALFKIPESFEDLP